ncbi:MAG: hypothetical protein P4L53_20785 [Candidatus Obscuribacterales bacterium]|nr:hypothetical protein [Candidatus Obscuribacterales bacterium]
MAKRSVIKKTAICWWEAEDEIFLVRSALLPIAIAQGETEAEAWSTYDDVLDDALESLAKGKLGGYAANGRPSKGGVNIHCQVQPFSKETLNHFVEEFGISQGEVIDWALFMAQHKFYEVQPPVNTTAAAEIGSRFAGVSEAYMHPTSSGEPQRINYGDFLSQPASAFSKEEIPAAMPGRDPQGERFFSMSTECFRNAFIRHIFSMKDEEIQDMAKTIRNLRGHD